MGFPIIEIRLPDLNEGQPAVLDRWLVAVGDYVEAGMPVASVTIDDESQNLSCSISVIIHELLIEANCSLIASQPLCRVMVEATEIPGDHTYSKLEKVA